MEKLIGKEEKMTGEIGIETYKEYARGGGYFLAIVVLVLCILVGAGKTVIGTSNLLLS
jgi:hypothetical protein